MLRKLVARAHGLTDKRQIIVSLTSKGEDILKRLSIAHRQELQETAPALSKAVHAIIRKNIPTK